nr:sigma factor-like helix-turn-helix DNA-binding protein [Brevundimonas diminuta]
MSFFKALGRLLGRGATDRAKTPERELEHDLSARIASVVEANSEGSAPVPGGAPGAALEPSLKAASVADAGASLSGPSAEPHKEDREGVERPERVASQAPEFARAGDRPVDLPQPTIHETPGAEPRREHPRPEPSAARVVEQGSDEALPASGAFTAEFNWRAALEAKGITPPLPEGDDEASRAVAPDEADPVASSPGDDETIERLGERAPSEAVEAHAVFDAALQELLATSAAIDAAEASEVDVEPAMADEPTINDVQQAAILAEAAEGVVADGDDAPAQAVGGLNLGDYPEDPLIADLVALNVTRVRLENAIGAAAKANALPLLCLSEYLERGADAQQVFMAEVPNLGRKSALELEVLVQTAASQIAALRTERKVADDKPLSTVAIRQAVAALFLGRETGAMLQSWVMPARFSNGIFNAGWLTTPFSDILLDFPQRIADLRQQPNMGSTSLAAGRQVVTRLLSEELDRRGFSPAQSASAAAALLDGRELAIVERVSLSNRLRALVAVGAPSDNLEGRLHDEASDEGDAEPSSLQILSTPEILSALGALFGDLPLMEAMAPHEPPARLQNSLINIGWGHETLATVLADFPSRISTLRQEPNVGRVSLDAWRRVTDALVHEHLERRGFTAEEASSLVKVVLDGGPIERAARERLTARFAGLAASHTGMTPSDVLAAFAVSDLPPPPPAAAPADPQALMSPLIDALDDRSRDIVKRRYGLEGPRETLEQIGVTYQVTRERIRQLERKALRRLRVQAQSSVRSSILLHGASAWRSLVQDRVVLHRDLGRRRRALSPWFELALELAEIELTTWLDSYGQSFGQGWIEPGRDIASLSELSARLAGGDFVGPQVLQTIAPQDDPDDVKGALLLMGRVLYGDYVLQERPRARLRRALRLHSLLGEIGKPKDVIKLVALYRERWADDQCSARDAEIVMEDQPQLFLEISEGFWASLGRYGQTPAAVSVQSPEQASEQEDADEEGLGEAALVEASDDEGVDDTVRGAIEAELRRAGPQRISEIMDRAETFLRPGRSSNSVAPILLAEKDVFARPLPGVYALHDQVLEPAELLRTRPAYLFEENQIRTYVMARRAGEPWGAYRLWRPDVEYLWSVWARKHADTDLLESLLSVIDVDAWPEVDDREEWRALAAARGRYSLQRPPREEAFGLPELEHVLAACKLIKSRGALSWVSANRVLFRRPADHTSAGLLAVLVALGALKEGAPDWQAPHDQGEALEPLLEELEAARTACGSVNWSTDLGQRLAAQARSAALSSGWVTREDMQTLFGSAPTEEGVQEVAEPVEELSFLEQLLADQTRRHETARLESVLEDFTAVQKDEA